MQILLELKHHSNFTWAKRYLWAFSVLKYFSTTLGPLIHWPDLPPMISLILILYLDPLTHCTVINWGYSQLLNRRPQQINEYYTGIYVIELHVHKMCTSLISWLCSLTKDLTINTWPSQLQLSFNKNGQFIWKVLEK